MNNDSNPSGEPKAPRPISAEEFDAMFDAGEDVSAYIDWDKGVMVEPGELSPGQKLSLQTFAVSGSIEMGGAEAAEMEQPLSIALPSWAFDQLQDEAERQGVSQEKLAQLLIIQRLDKAKVLP